MSSAFSFGEWIKGIMSAPNEPADGGGFMVPEAMSDFIVTIYPAWRKRLARITRDLRASGMSNEQVRRTVRRGSERWYEEFVMSV